MNPRCLCLSLLRLLYLLPVLLLLLGTPAAAGIITAPLQQKLDQASSADKVRVMIRFADQADLDLYARRSDRRAARREMLQDLHGRATRAQGALQRHLRQQGHAFTELWLINAVSAELPASLIATLATWPGVESIDAESIIPPPTPLPQAAPLAATPWNLSAVGAPTLWGQGINGSGVVVAVLDSGVNLAHPELTSSYRGGPNDWFDPYKNTTTPYDPPAPVTNFTHGTAVTSVILGSTLGVAPGAKWIAAKIFPDSGSATDTNIRLAFQWALDPDKSPLTDDAPDIVNNSWGYQESFNQCLMFFRAEIQALQAAGINVVFAAGNKGPEAFTSVSPGNNPEGLAVGAIDPSSSVSYFSSRGPSSCANSIYTPLLGASSDVFPEMVAPGRDIPVANGTNSTAVVSGTSFSTPHVSGALALLRQAVPPATPAASLDLEVALLSSTADIDRSGPDQNTGYGLLDIPATYYRLNNLPSLSLYTPGSPENDTVVDFGNVPPDSSRTLALRLDNVGGAALSLSLNTAVSLPFSYVDSDCQGSLAAGSSCSVNLAFSPTAGGPFSDSVQIVSNDPRQPNLLITLQGTGNTPPPAAILLAPAPGAKNQPTSVTFSWYQGADGDGDPLTMSLFVTDGANQRVFVLTLTAAGALLLLPLFPLLPLSLRQRRPRALLWLLAAALTGLLAAFAGCGGGGGGGTAISANVSHTVDNLATDTTYYWKVVTSDNNGNPVESPVRSFTTAP